MEKSNNATFLLVGGGAVGLALLAAKKKQPKTADPILGGDPASHLEGVGNYVTVAPRGELGLGLVDLGSSCGLIILAGGAFLAWKHFGKR